MKHSRRTFVATVAGTSAAALGLRYPAGAAEFTFKWSCDVAPDHPIVIHASEAAQAILRESGGRLEVRVFPNGQLGGQAQILQLVRTGAVEMATSFDAVTEAIVPVCGVTAVPFAFASHKQAWRAMKSPLDTYIRGAIAKVGLYPFEQCWDVGFRQIENNLRSISGPKELQGLKLRIPPSSTETTFFKGLGASPTDVNSAELYSALQTHLVDGLAVPLFTLSSRKMWEVVKYVSMSDHILTNYRLLANADAIGRLPKDLRDVLERNADAAGLQCSNDSDHADVALQPRLKANGMIFTDVDRPAFKAAIHTAGLYRQWREHFGAEVWGRLEKATQPLA